MRHGFTLIELLVVIGVIAVLASIILVAAMRVGDEAKQVRTQSFINECLFGIEKYRGQVRKFPFVADPNGDFSADDCLRELAPTTNELTAGRQPRDPGYRNTAAVECLTLPREMMVDPGDGKLHAADGWLKPYCMQFDWFTRKTMIWSAGADGRYDISDDPAAGGHSNLFATQAQAKQAAPPVITPAIEEQRIKRDVSNN